MAILLSKRFRSFAILCLLLLFCASLALGQQTGGPTGGNTATVGTSSACPNISACVDATTMPGSDMCQKITNAWLALPNYAGTVDARGFLGNQACTVATATGSATNGMFPNANCQIGTQNGSTCNGANIANGKLLLGAVNWYLPVVSSEAGYTAGGAGSKLNYERSGTVIVPPAVIIEGIGTAAGGAISGETNILACQSLGYQGLANCPAPAGTEVYQISSFTLTQSTSYPYRNYLAITTSSQSDIVAGEPFRISGAYSNTVSQIVDFNNSYTACESSAYADAITDPTCGGGSGPYFSTTGAGTVYAPVSSGIVNVQLTALGTTGWTSSTGCSLPPPTTLGVQATCVVTGSGGVLTGIYIVNRGTGYAPGATGSVTLTCPGSCTGTPAATYWAIPSSCTRATNVNCGYLYGELPLLHAISFKYGTSTGVAGVGVSMSDQFRNINVDCKFVPTCVGIAGRAIQEQSQIKDSWAGDSPDRDIDIHGFAAQNADKIDGLRVTIGTLVNRQKTLPAVGWNNTGNALTLATATNTFVPYGVYYIWGATGISCAQSTNTTSLPTYPTYVPLVALSVTATSVTLDAIGTSCGGSGTITVAGSIGEICEPGKEAMYWGDVGPHGNNDFTADLSNCTNSGGFPVAVNAAFRMNVSSTSSDYGLGGHAEGAMYGVLAGDSNPFKGMAFLSWSGIATPNIGGFGNFNQAGGEYQAEQTPSAIKIRSEYYSTITNGTTDYLIENIQRNNANALYYTINDDNPINATLTDGAHIQDGVTTLYAVDQTPLCESLLTTASTGSALGCPQPIAPGKGGTALIFQGLTGGTAAAITQNVVTIFGSFYNQNLVTATAPHFNWNVAFADNTANVYDLGLYGPCLPGQTSCPLIIHLGATGGGAAGTAFAPSTGLKGGAVTTYPNPFTLLPGNYYLAATTNCSSTCATLVTGPVQMELVAANSVTASSGGVLPAAITIPAASITSASVPQTGIH